MWLWYFPLSACCTCPEGKKKKTTKGAEKSAFVHFPFSYVRFALLPASLLSVSVYPRFELSRFFTFTRGPKSAIYCLLSLVCVFGSTSSVGSLRWVLHLGATYSVFQHFLSARRSFACLHFSFLHFRVPGVRLRLFSCSSSFVAIFK